jgi:glutathione-regulated potassium-efflux system ancillary protein KefC
VDAIWVGAAYLAGWLGLRVGFPPLVGYLLAGFVLYLTGIRSGEALQSLADIGVWLLLFTVGLKLRFQNLIRPEVLGVGGLHLIISSAVMIGVMAASLGISNALYVAVGLAFSSTVLAIKLLEDKRELNSYHGRIVVGILILQDLVAIVLLAFAGAKQPTFWALGVLTLPLLRPLVLRLLSKSGHEELLLLFGLSLALAGGTLAQQVGISPELGALVFGAVLAGHERTTELSRVLWGLKEAFLVAFFLTIGLGGLPPLELLSWIPIFLAVLPLQGILFFWLFLRFGLRARTAFVTSAALASYGEFALIVVKPLINSGQLEAGWASLLGVVIAVSLAIAAPLNRAIHMLYEKLEPWLLRFEGKQDHLDREPTSLGKANWLVIGMGRTGGAAYKQLEASGQRVIGLDSDPDKLERHRAKGRRVLYGDAEDPELWEQLELQGLSGVIVTAPDFEARIRALEGLKRRKFIGKVAVLSHHLEEEPSLEKAGATLVFRPFSEAGERLAQRALETI